MEPWHVESGGMVFQLSMYMMRKLELSKRNASTQISSQKNWLNIIMEEIGEEQLREIPCEESDMLVSKQTRPEKLHHYKWQNFLPKIKKISKF